MNDELDILNIVNDNPSVSQRKIAEQTGISLGQVNFLIKKCVRKGLIKIEGQTPKSIRYNLTPKGFLEKAEKTLQYVKISYAGVIRMTNRVKALGQQYSEEGCIIYLPGSRDEMMEICLLALNDTDVKYHVGAPSENEADDSAVDIKQPAVVFYWEQAVADRYKSFNCVNILN